MLLKSLFRRRHKWVRLDPNTLSWVWQVRPQALKLSEYLWVGHDGRYFRCDECKFYRKLKAVGPPLSGETSTLWEEMWDHTGINVCPYTACGSSECDCEKGLNKLTSRRVRHNFAMSNREAALGPQEEAN